MSEVVVRIGLGAMADTHSHDGGRPSDVRFAGGSLVCAVCGEDLGGCMDEVWLAEGEKFYHVHGAHLAETKKLSWASAYCTVCGAVLGGDS